MKYRITAVSVCTAMLLAGCQKIETSTWQSDSIRLRKSETYSWAPEGLRTGGDTRIKREALTPRIVSAVEAELNEKGYRKAEDNADLLLYPSVQIVDKPEHVVSQADTRASDVGALQRRGAFDWEWVTPEEVSVDVYEEGTLLLSVTDAASGETLWQGSASLRVDQSASPAQKVQLANKVVRALLKTFPAKTGMEQ
ncbi:MAG TPA: DUF4136 domain-containing protein [Pontiella sp.]|nr:DUF4136 domain-containing protein [Pontiella sp.]